MVTNSSLDTTKGRLVEYIPGLDETLAEIAGNSSVRTTKLTASYGTIPSLSNAQGTITDIAPKEGILRAVRSTNDSLPPFVKDGCFSTSSGSSNTTEIAQSTPSSSWSGGSGGSVVINGFLDKTKTWPTEYRWGETDWHRFTGRPPGEICGGGETTYQKEDGESSWPLTHEETRYESRVGGDKIPAVSTALETEWEEPESDKATKYGDTWVWASPGGVTMELDSTTGTQAWRVTHPSNSYMEIDGEGNFNQKTYAKRYDIIAKGHFTFVNDERCTTLKKGDDLHVYGATTILRHKDKLETILMNDSLNILMCRELKIGIDDSIMIVGTQEMEVGMNQSIMVGMTQEITTGLNFALTTGVSAIVTAGVSLRMEAGAIMKFEAPTIFLN